MYASGMFSSVMLVLYPSVLDARQGIMLAKLVLSILRGQLKYFQKLSSGIRMESKSCVDRNF